MLPDGLDPETTYVVEVNGEPYPLGDYRPGRRAARELDVVSPLDAAGLTGYTDSFLLANGTFGECSCTAGLPQVDDAGATADAGSTQPVADQGAPPDANAPQPEPDASVPRGRGNQGGRRDGVDRAVL